jgi:tetratricopeptide (TPR) repeat protein
MRRARLTLLLLFVACFTMAVSLQPRLEARNNRPDERGNTLALLLGDGRQMIADRLLGKADAYFHNGKYPSIFEQNAAPEENHMAAAAAGQEDHDEHEAATPAHDWIEAFGRHFIPDKHVHLEGGKEREILPWLQMSIELNPQDLQTYLTAAYFLGDRLGKVDEAEELLRDGLKINPKSPDLLYVLGHLEFEERHNLARARSIWLVALRRWHDVEDPKPEKTETGEGQRNLFLLEEILGGLVKVETAAGNLDKALDYLKLLKANSPDPEGVQKQIDELQAKLNAGAGQTNQPAGR